MHDHRKAPALPFAYPVAVKVLSADIAHKTEAGGVALNVPRRRRAGRGDQVHARDRASRTGITPDRVLVAPMIAGIGEALIGYRVDREVGPLVMVAAGGVTTEIYRDRSLRLAPVDLADRARDDRRGEGLRDAEGFPRQAARAISTRWRTPSWRSRSLRCRMTRRSPRPRSIR